MKKNVLPYHGLVTRRMTIEAPLMQTTSTVKVRVKTSVDSSTKSWIDDDEELLSTSFDNPFPTTL